jgi:hypothetical protein
VACPRYFWTVVQPLQEDNLAERLKFCKDCWDNRFQKPTTLKEIERENQDPLSEEEKQREDQNEFLTDHYNKRFRAS